MRLYLLPFFVIGPYLLDVVGEPPAPVPQAAIEPVRQVSIAQSGVPAGGVYGLGRAPKSIRQFRGLCTTYLLFRLPKLPAGRAYVRGRLLLHADYISSTKYTPRVWASMVKGKLPGALSWEGRPEGILLTRTRAVEVKQPGPFEIEIREGLRGGDLVFKINGGGGGYRWLWWRADKTPRLALWTGPAESVISVMAASRDEPLPPERDLPGLLPAWRQLKSVPILQYFWPRTKPGERLPTLGDYLQMGFTGTYKSDGDPPWGGRLFLERGLHGFMLQSPFANRGKPVIGHDGKPAPFPGIKRLGNRRHPFCNSIFSPDNAEYYYAYLIRFGRDYGLENLFHAGRTIVMSSWDETGLYSRRFLEYAYSAREEFAAYLKNVAFHDRRPDEDTNRDGRTFNRETGLQLDDWTEVPLPAKEERFQGPGLWKHFIDFHGYYTYLFFHRGSLILSKAFHKDAELFPFSHATAKWVGRPSWIGLDLYWQSKLNRILTVEDCQADYPGSSIHYAFTDQLSRRYGLPVMGWSWWWPDAERSNDPLEFGRALARAMGHNCHGLNFWVYGKSWSEKPAARAAAAHWHRVFQAHWNFLKNATVPAPHVAVVRSRNTGNMYPGWEYPKLDAGWTIAALTEAHVPFEVIADNQIEFEPDILNDYKALIIPTATWESARVRRAVEKFVARGGFVYTDGDSFMLDNSTGRTMPFLERVFAVTPKKKYKGLFAPTYDSAEERRWARESAAQWQSPKWEKGPHQPGSTMKPIQMSDAGIAELRKSLPRISGTGLPNELNDPRQNQWIRAVAGADGLPARHRTFHDIITGTNGPKGTALATYRGEVCAVETERTLWTGFRPGHDHGCIYPLSLMRKWGEPVWPFHNDLSQDADGRSGPRTWITRIVEKAGIQPLVSVSRAGRPAPQIEVLVRQDPSNNAMVFVINHEGNPGPYRFAGIILEKSEKVCELRTSTWPKRDGRGAYTLEVMPYDVAILAAGRREFVAGRLAAHRAIPRQVKSMPGTGN